jgi:protein involved in ribonucleotide reduction
VQQGGNKMIELQNYAENKTKVRVTFASGNKKWGWVHLYQDRYYLTRGNRVGFLLDTATKIEEIK